MLRYFMVIHLLAEKEDLCCILYLEYIHGVVTNKL